MQTLEYDLLLAEAMLNELKAYLLSEEMFWPLSGRPAATMPPFPRMTLGGLRVVFDELQAYAPEMDAQQARRHAEVLGAFDRASQRGPVAIERKALRELKTRLTMWMAYLGDLEERPQSAEVYPREVQLRVMIERLLPLAGRSPELAQYQATLKAADLRLLRKLRSQPFIWDPRLESLYPRQDFSYLYGSPLDR